MNAAQTLDDARRRERVRVDGWLAAMSRRHKGVLGANSHARHRHACDCDVWCGKKGRCGREVRTHPGAEGGELSPPKCVARPRAQSRRRTARADARRAASAQRCGSHAIWVYQCNAQHTRGATQRRPRPAQGRPPPRPRHGASLRARAARPTNRDARVLSHQSNYTRKAWRMPKPSSTFILTRVT